MFIVLSLRTKSKLRDDKALILHIADADQVSILSAAFFLSIRPCLWSANEVETVAIVGNPGVGTVSMLNWYEHTGQHNTEELSEVQSWLPGRPVILNTFTYLVEELVETQLCSRCSPVSWCTMNFAKSAAQKSPEKHSCILGWGGVVLKQKHSFCLFCFLKSSIFNGASLLSKD